MELTRVRNDINGNPRHVCHFLDLLTDAEKARSGAAWLDIPTKYAIALRRAKVIGGRKYHNRQFGGGIVFKCYGADDLRPHVARVLAEGAQEERDAENLRLSIINDGATYDERKRIVRRFFADGAGTRAYTATMFDLEQMARAEAKKQGIKPSHNAFILAAHGVHAYMVEHYHESNNGADWI